MKTRAFWYALIVGATSFSTGCCCFRECFPNVGWRLHGCCHPCPPACGPVCSPCAPSPAFRPPMVVTGPDCPGCVGGAGPGFAQPVGYPPVAYPPVIGKPMPIPGATPSNELHNPTPLNPTPTPTPKQ